ncbi:protein-export protein SecB [Geobacter sp. OR-1]|uniref:protein-export chaperone SecB n=1 Tax=Geobacter sp. OR-1 TaxID=1266765 RepID=UPI000542D1E7|nr:protein-export chaperone SecB [Geobacter sp. OR-1]GAM11340.1 protein-export protein SecB [Geobacter sp. OR-1]
MANEAHEFTFEDFRIISTHFDLDLKKISELTENKEVGAKLSLRHEYSEEINTLRLFMKVELDGEETPFKLLIECISHFSFSNKITNMAAVAQVAEINCAAIIYPYMRETVADLVRRAGFPPLHLPRMNFVEFYKSLHPGVPPVESEC